MDLGNNWIETIPAAALEPRHQQLMAGTTLSGNELGLHELEDLRTYLLQTGNGLGYSAQELEGLINPSRSTSEAEFSGAEHVFQNHPDIEPVHVQKNRWFATLEADSPGMPRGMYSWLKRAARTFSLCFPGWRTP